jgi:hypothetical protein
VYATGSKRSMRDNGRRDGAKDGWEKREVNRREVRSTRETGFFNLLSSLLEVPSNCNGKLLTSPVPW